MRTRLAPSFHTIHKSCPANAEDLRAADSISTCHVTFDFHIIPLVDAAAGVDPSQLTHCGHELGIGETFHHPVICFPSFFHRLNTSPKATCIYYPYFNVPWRHDPSHFDKNWIYMYTSYKWRALIFDSNFRTIWVEWRCSHHIPSLRILPKVPLFPPASWWNFLDWGIYCFITHHIIDSILDFHEAISLTKHWRFLKVRQRWITPTLRLQALLAHMCNHPARIRAQNSSRHILADAFGSLAKLSGHVSRNDGRRRQQGSL